MLECYGLYGIPTQTCLEHGPPFDNPSFTGGDDAGPRAFHVQAPTASLQVAASRKKHLGLLSTVQYACNDYRTVMVQVLCTP